MNGYSHPYRWSTVYIAVTAEQEARLFAKGCEMADMNLIIMITEAQVGAALGQTFYGPNHIKYDKGAAFFSFISKRNIWKPSKTKMICNRACGEVLMVVWPDIFDIKPDRSISGNKTIPPHEQTPDQTEHLVRHYVDTNVDLGNPTQQDIDNIITEVNKE
jgi:hypothetical protein